MNHKRILKHAGYPEISLERRSYDFLARCRICGKRLTIAEHPAWIPHATEILMRAHVRGCKAKVENLLLDFEQTVDREFASQK